MLSGRSERASSFEGTSKVICKVDVTLSDVVKIIYFVLKKSITQLHNLSIMSPQLGNTIQQ